MSLFDRKKSRESAASVLSEEEIQKRLYGEFKTDPTRVAGAGERESVAVRTAPPALKAQPADATSDLFSPAKESPEKTARPETFVTSREIKPAEVLSKPVFTRSSDRTSFSASPSSGTFPRVREIKNPSASGAAVFGDAAGALKKAGTFFAGFFDPERVLVRQVLYWTVGVLVVFFLFWGVNALNVRREMNMKTPPAPKAEPADAQRTVAPQIEAGTISASDGSRDAGTVSDNVTVPDARPIAYPSRKPAASVASDAAAGRFVIQVAVYPSEDYAARLVTSLKQAGFNGFVKESVRPSGSVQYWVLIGGFRTASEAHQQLSKFKASEVSRPFADAYIKTLVTE